MAKRDKRKRKPRKWRKLGFVRGQITISDDFDAPLPNAALNDFEGQPLPARKKS